MSSSSSGGGGGGGGCAGSISISSNRCLDLIANT